MSKVILNQQQQTHSALPINNTANRQPNPENIRQMITAFDYIKNKTNAKPSNSQQLNNSNLHNNNDIQSDQSTETVQIINEIYAKFFGQQQLQAKQQQYKSSTSIDCSQQVNNLLLDDIMQEIARLQTVEKQHSNIMAVLGKGSKNKNNDDKWKLILLSYREKMNILEGRVSEERRLKCMLQERLDLLQQDVDRLEHMNKLRFQKINTLVVNLQQKQIQVEDLNKTITELQNNLTKVYEEHSQLQEQLQYAEHQKLQISMKMDQAKQINKQMQTERDKTITVLSQEEEQINRQLADLKIKYQTQIATLEMKISSMQIEKEEMLLEMMKQRNDKYDVAVQTQEKREVVRACFFNSLADDMSGQDLQDYELNQDQEQYDFDLHLDAIPSKKHKLDTDRQNEVAGHLSDRDQEDNHNQQIVEDAADKNILTQPFLPQMSFDEGRSMSTSNAPSRYVETVQHLTQQLTEAYNKINSLTNQIQELQKQKTVYAKVEKKQQTRKQQRQVQNQLNSSLGGYLSSFFKK